MAPQNDTSYRRTRNGSETAEEVDGAVDGIVVLNTVDFGDRGGKKGVIPACKDAVEDDKGEEAGTGGVIPKGKDGKR